MRCGQNFHGGNVQNGCGAEFSWNGAPAYVADAGVQRTPEELKRLPPDEVRANYSKTITCLCNLYSLALFIAPSYRRRRFTT